MDEKEKDYCIKLATLFMLKNRVLKIQKIAKIGLIFSISFSILAIILLLVLL